MLKIIINSALIESTLRFHHKNMIKEGIKIRYDEFQ